MANVSLYLSRSCPGIRHWTCYSRRARVCSGPWLRGWLDAVCWKWEKRVLTLMEGLVGRGCPARSRLMDERVRNASPLLVATCRQACCPEDAQLGPRPAVLPACCWRHIYHASYMHGDLAKTHQNERRGPASGGGGRPVSDAAVYATKQWANKPQAAPDPGCIWL